MHRSSLTTGMVAVLAIGWVAALTTNVALAGPPVYKVDPNAIGKIFDSIKPTQPPGGGYWKQDPPKQSNPPGYKIDPGAMGKIFDYITPTQPPGGGFWRPEPPKPSQPPGQSPETPAPPIPPWWSGLLPLDPPPYKFEYGIPNWTEPYSPISPGDTPVPRNTLPKAGPNSPRGGKVVNPENTGGSVSYVLNGRSYTLQPGYSQQLPAGRSSIIEFDRGGSFGRARYTLREGTYLFKVTEQGWDVVRKVYRVTLDNTANATDFHYVVDNKSATVAAGQSQTHKSNHPIVLLFDAGNGGAPVRKVLEKGVYLVQINPQTQLWDLLPPEQSLASLAQP